MTPFLSLCLPFYRNSGMLAEQYRHWSAYPEAVKAQIEVVLVDDGSPEAAMEVPRPEGLPPLRIFRVLKDIPWHQHGARNLAAHHAQGEWLLLTDMDHVLPADSLVKLLARLQQSKNEVYRFKRLDAPKLRPTVDAQGRAKLHVNTFAIRKETFWQIGGYDEDCVGYGTDGYFRHRLEAVIPFTYLQDVPIVRYPREVIADASTRPDTPMDPKLFRDRGRRSLETRTRLSAKAKSKAGPTVLAFEWERAL